MSIKSSIVYIASSVVDSFGLSPVAAALQRHFTTFDSTAQNYIELGSDIELAGDFTYEQDVFTPSAPSDSLRFFGKSDDFISRARVVASGEINITADNRTSYTTTGAVFNPYIGKLTRLKIERVGGTTRVYLAGNEVGSTNSLTGSFLINQLNRQASVTSDKDCIHANVKIIDNGTTVLDMPIDEQLSGSETTVLDKSPSANNGTFFNGSASSSELFTFYEQGFWLGENGTILELPESTTLFSSDDMLLESSDNIILEAANG